MKPDRKNDKKGPKSIMRAVMNKVNNLRSIRMNRDRPNEKVQTQQEKKESLERALMLRMQAWGKAHNLPDWAQAKMAQAMIKEDERRKKRAELQVRKGELLKQATLKHAIVVGFRAAEGCKKKAEEARKLMPELRKGDAEIPYKLESLNLDSLVSTSTEGSVSASASSEKPETSQQATGGAPKDPKAAKDMDDCLLQLLEKATESQAAQSIGPSSEVLTAEEEVEKLIEYLDKRDNWEKESKDNALYNWLISQSSPDDIKNKPVRVEGPHVVIEPKVKGKTFPSRQKIYDKGEPSDEFEGKTIG